MKNSLAIYMLLCVSRFVNAQPANDNCVDATPMNYADAEAQVAFIDGDTRQGTPDESAGYPCSGTWWQDDVWFTLTTPGFIPENGITIRARFGSEGSDIPAVGIGLYTSCASDAVAYACFSSDIPALDSLNIDPTCLSASTLYYVRVWSGFSANEHSGTFRIGAFANPYALTKENILWEETFDNGLNGWSTFGFCGGNIDSSINAVWHYLPDGLLDQGSFAPTGFGITSQTVCNGAVGVDCDYDDNRGNALNPDGTINAAAYGTGPCPTGSGSQYLLVSPAISHSTWGVEGITITWTQSIRQHQSEYWIGYRRFANGIWNDWNNIRVNRAYPDANDTFHSQDMPRVFLGGAEQGDSLQLRFVYNANYYFWGIDDVRLVEAPCVDLRSRPEFYAIAPAVQIPVSQVYPWWPLNDIDNVGFCTQSNVNLNFTLTNSSGTEVYNMDLGYGDIQPDSLAENKNFNTPVNVSNAKGALDTYTGTYTVTSDASGPETDYDFADNVNQMSFTTTEGLYALETGPTRNVAVSTALYEQGAPWSYTCGNYFYFPKGMGYRLSSVTWGVANPSEVAGTPIHLYLYQWTDTNQNDIAEASERQLIGGAEHTFDGSEPDNLLLETALESVLPGSGDVLLQDDGAYLMMIEYDAPDQTLFFVLASDAYHYGGVILSSLQADRPTYASVLGFAPDGDLENVDYELTEFGPDGRWYLGWDIVPLIRLNVEKTSASTISLPVENRITLYPNPANDLMKLNLTFELPMKEVQIIVMDALGKSVLLQNYHEMEGATLEFNVTKWIPGAYTAFVNTKQGSRAISFIVQH